jgi:hypothetical protein
MYATSSTSNVYHLVTSTRDRTVCGLAVAPVVVDRAAYISTLHLTSSKPDRRELCRDCAKVEQKRIMD